MKKLAIVSQRYGLEVNGGAEYYARLIAEKLSAHYDVEVLTTKAVSYKTWANHYTADQETINGIPVHRFRVVWERMRVPKTLLYMLIKWLHCNFKVLSDLWILFQGPLAPDLIRYIEANQEKYDCFLFITYMYYPTVVGMEKVKENAVFIPTAHDEPYIHFASYRTLFSMPKGIIYLTDEEKAFVEKTFGNQHIPSVVAGSGVDLPPQVDNACFRSRYGIDGDYLIYVGRVDRGKGCGEMFTHFQKYVQNHPKLHLVALGQAFMDIPQHPNIHYLGFVSEQDKFDGIFGAKALWLPSQFESLSIAVLEAMSLSVPILVNGKCQVLKGHCTKSSGGLFYEDYASFAAVADALVYNEENHRQLSENARRYIEERYQWPQIIGRIKSLIEI